jgi:acetate kinase
MAVVSIGKSEDTSFGFSSSSGLVMGTSSGNIDPFIIF